MVTGTMLQMGSSVLFLTGNDAQAERDATIDVDLVTEQADHSQSST